MPQVIQLPPRSNAILYDPDEVAEVAKLLETVKYPQAVVIDDVVCKTLTSARNRANVMRTELMKMNPGKKYRAHGIQTSEETETKTRINGKGEQVTYEVGEFRAAISPGAEPRPAKKDKDAPKK
jgi:hypothetical protein